MKEKKKNSAYVRMIWLFVGMVLTVVGFMCIPQLIKKYGNKLYKKSLKTDDIDFENMGPEIVINENVTEEE